MDNIMDKLGIKRLVTLLLVIAYIGMQVYGMISGKNLPDGFVGMVSMCLGYYFSKTNINQNETKIEDIKETVEEAKG